MLALPNRPYSNNSNHGSKGNSSKRGCSKNMHRMIGKDTKRSKAHSPR